MGIQVPFFGYVLGRGRPHLRGSRTSTINRKSIQEIEDFGVRCANIPGERFLVQGERPLSEWCPTDGLLGNATTFVPSVRLEKDADERPELHVLLDERARNGVGTIVIPTLAHFRDEALTEGMQECIRRMQREVVPVIILEVQYEKVFANVPDNEVFLAITRQTLSMWTRQDRMLGALV